jgi:hypothetical protein
MTAWTSDELTKIGAADALAIAAYRHDGTPRPSVTIWVVRVGDDLYVRSWRGREGGWFRHALQTRRGRIRAAGVERDVAFEEPDEGVRGAIDRAYRAKYARYGDAYVGPMIGPDAAAATFRLIPR